MRLISTTTSTWPLGYNMKYPVIVAIGLHEVAVVVVIVVVAAAVSAVVVG